MTTFEINGILHKKYDTEAKSASFQTREFVLSLPDDRFPQFVKFQLAQERVNLIDPYSEGAELKVYFDLRGREWQGKYFTNLNAWKIEGASKNSGVPVEITNQGDAPPFDLQDDVDDLPF